MSNWSGKQIVVSGGSQGLGLEIAKAFGKRGTTIILLARTEETLKLACKQLESDGVTASFQTCDATRWDSVQAAFQKIEQENGPIDGLINVIGKSCRTDILNMDLDEARDLMEFNYFTALHCIKASLSSIRTTNGHIVNIGSLSSKTAWPYMTPYTASKFALAGLTHQLRVELGDQLHAMLVCPGPIKREDSGKRYDRQAEGLPDDAKKPAGGAKLKGICPIRLAEKIVRGCEKRKAEIIVPWKSKLLFAISSLSTRLGDWLIKKYKKS